MTRTMSHFKVNADYNEKSINKAVISHQSAAEWCANLELFPGFKKHQTFLFLLTVFECTICLLVHAARPLQAVPVVYEDLKLSKA